MAVSERDTVVRAGSGPLNAIVARSGDVAARAGLVLVDGSGPATRDAWQGVPGWLAERGVVTLRHDKPGCGGSPGDWRQQSFGDRAAEALAAVGTLREQEGVERVGFDPAALIGSLRCPIMAFFGAADEVVPVERSVAVLADRLPGLHRGTNGIAVLPGVGHMLYPVPPAPGPTLFEQLSPAFLPLLTEFIDRVSVRGPR